MNGDHEAITGLRRPESFASLEELLHDGPPRASGGATTTPASPVRDPGTVGRRDPSAVAGPANRNDDDDHDDDDEIVRSFMLTKGRTRTTVQEIAIETLIVATPASQHDQRGLSPEHAEIVRVLTAPLSVAEVSAHLGIPLRAAVILTSEMLVAGTIRAGSTVEATSIDHDFLSQIRNALQLL